ERAARHVEVQLRHAETQEVQAVLDTLVTRGRFLTTTATGHHRLLVSPYIRTIGSVKVTSFQGDAPFRHSVRSRTLRTTSTRLLAQAPVTPRLPAPFAVRTAVRSRRRARARKRSRLRASLALPA